ncbi:DMT family transporter [Candidatus Cytomitobacter indipagum]|uniref:DMT family transporter n=1 Tax=Candidatus Cytomitobacter indipagum TaxID=2601575 RepID=A0A5C0UDS7_9PROT|nr:DMT family transporter [Candidatus Cytomitobacter indipagum]QEK37840.1 DMT family transporter [Candidatus Cytomitobacter indipagum]
MIIYRFLPFLYISSYVVILFFVKQLQLDSSLKALSRFMVSFIVLSPLFIINRDKLKTKNHKIYFIRAVIACCAVLLTYRVYSVLPFTSATSISLSEPLFSALLSFLILREQISSRKWIMLLIGYIGVLVSMWPIDFANKYLVMQGLLILANIVVSFNSVIMKKLSTNEDTVTVLFYSYIYIIPLLWMVNAFMGNNLCCSEVFTYQNMKILIPIGVLGGLNNILMIFSLKKLPVSTFTSAQYFRIFLATAFSIFIGECISIKEIVGSIIIVVSSAFM